MNRVRIVTIMVISVIVTTSTAYALEKKSLAAIDTDQLTEDTQFSAPCGDDHVNVLWWIPVEFWQALYVNDKTTSESDKKAVIDALKPYSLLMICQSDISAFGSFNFYSKEEIENKLDITYGSGNGSLVKITPLKDINPDLQILLDVFKPVLTSAMGNMGQNMHFFVLKGYDSTQKRAIDPYALGELNIRIGERNGKLLQAQLNFPLNSLYMPRKCPNGKDAHVTWQYCPWSGKKLED